MGDREANGTRMKQCHCPICRGLFVNTKTYYHHTRKMMSNPDEKPPVPKTLFEEDMYKDEVYQKPLYEGSQISLIDAVFEHFFVFSSNNGMSKSAMTDALSTEKSHLPQPNCLPESYRDARKLIKPLLMPLMRYEACVNDCMIFKGNHLSSTECLHCGEQRSQKNKKIFHYMPVGPRLARWFGTSNLCQLLFAGQCIQNGTLGDFTDGKIYKGWYEDGGVFSGTPEDLTVPLALFTDGVNPNRNISAQKSMWPMLLSWINLPSEIRHLLGPMLLVGIIPSGKNGSEPKSLEPYVEVLVDEMLQLSEYPVLHSYKKAPVNIKVALLQYLCDIPAYSKLLHLTGHAGLRGCTYCKEVGQYNKLLNKTIHPSNRCFLKEDHALRTSNRFPRGSVERRSEPLPFQPQEERVLREIYDQKGNKSQKQNHQKQYGLKGQYCLMKLPYHNRLEQMQPDGMHTLADFLSHVMDLLVGKSDTKNVRQSEKACNRFADTWLQETEMSLMQPKSSQLPPAPWRLSPGDVKEADKRASMISYPVGTDITPGPHFSKPWTLRTMNAKLQFVRTGAFQWCLKDLLPKRQERTLFKVLNVITRMTNEEIQQADVPKLQEDTHVALSLLERDFPLTLQNLVTHLIHHIVDGLDNNGPLYGRWLFPYERANGWMSRQGLKKGNEEATIMETYVIYDMLLSQKLYPKTESYTAPVAAANFIKNVLSGNARKDFGKVIGKATEEIIPNELLNTMKDFYQMEVGVMGLRAESVQFQKAGSKKMVRYSSCESSLSRKNSSVVAVLSSETLTLGIIDHLYVHEVASGTFYWAVLNLLCDISVERGVYKGKNGKDKTIVQLKDLSRPLVSVVGEDDYIYVLNCV